MAHVDLVRHVVDAIGDRRRAARHDVAPLDQILPRQRRQFSAHTGEGMTAAELTTPALVDEWPEIEGIDGRAARGRARHTLA